MSDGTINYQYETINDFHQHMRDKVQQLETALESLRTQTHQVLDGHWSGQAASAYDEKSKQIQTNLDGVKTWVNTLATSVSDGVNNMQDTDKKLAGQMGG